MISFGFPLIAEIEFTNGCNLYCDFCDWNRQNDLDVIPLQVVDILKETGTTTIGVYGGEPFLYADKLEEFVNKCVDGRIGTVITTNGTLIEENAVVFKSLQRAKSVIRFEIFSHNEKEHDRFTKSDGSWKKFIRSIEIVSNYDLTMVAEIKLFPIDAQYVKKIIDFIQQLGINTINFSIYPYTKWDKIDYKYLLGDIISKADKAGLRLLSDTPFMSLLSSRHGGFCPAGRLSFFISSDGTVFPCKFVRMPCGNIFKNNMHEIWEHPTLKAFREVPEECSSCHFIKRCSGGCRARAFSLLGRLDKKDPLCFYEEGLVKSGI